MKTLETFYRNTCSLKLIFLCFLIISITSCSKDDGPPPAPEAVVESIPEEEEIKLSSEKQMTGFRFAGIENNGVTVDIPGEIDEQGKAIAVEMPSGTEITVLEPALEIPDKAVYEPTGPQDFSTPINYTVTAEDGTSRTYLVTVDVALSQKEILLIIAAANPGNTLDWKGGDNLSDWEEVTLDGNGNIIELYLDERQLTIIPPEIGQLGSLRLLELGLNDLSSLPPEIGQLGSLRALGLTGNDLSSPPPEIWQLSSLEILKLGGNDLNIPPEIGQLGSLEFLSWFDSDLTNLPIELKQLVNLKTLDLRNNNLSQFDHVPFIPSIGGISVLDCSTETNLETLRLSGNPDLEVLDQCICDLDTDKGGTIDIDVVPNGVRCEDNNVIGN